ncbi:hypothetical protein J2T12_005085 [Paenibacillus anaericanus]|uniref:hypothetical protein n=1 Tax=Paenibacillus anaericanus TaxID=170367 RepID=UPI00278121EF|nr:hypothetical protein [Paenibacillus anaericanus]MDQ0091645.1 hypothetical protein [Paenibacillus anaericanus]
MREYKFRGKSVEPLAGDSQWLIGFGVHVAELSDGGKEYWLYTENGTYQVNPETVGQVFDVGDKEENELYPGDIIKTFHTRSLTAEDGNDPFSSMQQIEEYEKIGSLEYYRGYNFGPRLRWKKGHMMIPNTSTLWRMKAIKLGNRWDNPELLEVESNG